MKFLNFLYLLWAIFALLDRDPDPLTRLNPNIQYISLIRNTKLNESTIGSNRLHKPKNFTSRMHQDVLAIGYLFQVSGEIQSRRDFRQCSRNLCGCSNLTCKMRDQRNSLTRALLVPAGVGQDPVTQGLQVVQQELERMFKFNLQDERLKEQSHKRHYLFQVSGEIQSRRDFR